MPISVNMFGLTFLNDAHIRSKNGLPHQTTTGVASASSIQLTADDPRRSVSEPPVSMSPIVRTKTGKASMTPTQNRRVMSTSSGFGASLRSATRGSSAIPHLGHAPGRLLMTSGCIGQVYSTDGGAGGVRGFKPPGWTTAACIASGAPERYRWGSA